MRYCQIPLQSYLTVNQRNKLTLRLHAIKNVVLVRYYSKAVRIFYKDSINKLAIIQVLGYKVNIPVVNKPKETLPVKKDINNELQAYKRDAIISLVGFVGLQVLKKFAPQVYTSLNIVRRHMEPFIVDVEPTEESHFSLSSHEGEEFIYVMEGAVEVCHGKKCHLIKAGDSIYYDSIVPHHVHGYQGQAAKILAVIYTPI